MLASALQTLILILAFAACEGASAPAPPDPIVGATAVDSALGELSAHHAAGRSEEAEAAWVRAHDAFETDLAPAIADRRARLLLAHRFALVRARLEGPAETTDAEAIDSLREAIEAARASLPPPPATSP